MTTEVRSKPRLSRGVFYIAVIGLVVLGIAGFIFWQRGDGSAVNIASGKPRPLPVNVARVERVNALQIEEQYTGLVAARRSSSLGFETGGRIEAIRVDVGDRVEKAQALAVLDTRTLRANLNASKAQIGEAEAALKLARTTVDRQKKLEEKGLLSAQTYDEASAQSEAALARLNAAKASTEALEVQISLSTLRAPFAGVITRRLVDEGAIAAPGQPVLQLVESSVLEASVGLPGDLASRLEPGNRYELIIEGKSVEAELRALTGVIDANMRTVTAVFDMTGIPGVQPGAVARLQTSERLEQDGFWLPVSAMTEANRGLWAVYIVQEDDAGDLRTEKRLVDVIHAEASRVFVRGALANGERYVLNGLHRLAPGQIVDPVERDPAEFAER